MKHAFMLVLSIKFALGFGLKRFSFLAYVIFQLVPSTTSTFYFLFWCRKFWNTSNDKTQERSLCSFLVQRNYNLTYINRERRKAKKEDILTVPHPGTRAVPLGREPVSCRRTITGVGCPKSQGINPCCQQFSQPPDHF